MPFPVSALSLLWLLRALVKLVHLDDLAYEKARSNAESVGVMLAEVLPHDRQLDQDAQHALRGEYGSDCARKWTI